MSWGSNESRVVGCLLPEKGREGRDSNEGSGKQLGIPAPESSGVLSGKDMISASLSLWSSTDTSECGSLGRIVGAPQFMCKMQAVNHSSPLGIEAFLKRNSPRGCLFETENDFFPMVKILQRMARHSGGLTKAHLTPQCSRMLNDTRHSLQQLAHGKGMLSVNSGTPQLQEQRHPGHAS